MFILLGVSYGKTFLSMSRDVPAVSRNFEFSKMENKSIMVVMLTKINNCLCRLKMANMM